MATKEKGNFQTKLMKARDMTWRLQKHTYLPLIFTKSAQTACKRNNPTDKDTKVYTWISSPPIFISTPPRCNVWPIRGPLCPPYKSRTESVHTIPIHSLVSVRSFCSVRITYWLLTCCLFHVPIVEERVKWLAAGVVRFIVEAYCNRMRLNLFEQRIFFDKITLTWIKTWAKILDRFGEQNNKIGFPEASSLKSTILASSMDGRRRPANSDLPRTWFLTFLL